MTFSEYLSIETKAGGMDASDRDIIKAIRSMMECRGGKTHEMRTWRHYAIRDALKHKATARAVQLKTTKEVTP